MTLSVVSKTCLFSRIRGILYIYKAYAKSVAIQKRSDNNKGGSHED